MRRQHRWPSIPCIDCDAPALPVHITHTFPTSDGRFVTVPNFPAYRCPQCGQEFLDLLEAVALQREAEEHAWE